jgi:hypothetical protein
LQFELNQATVNVSHSPLAQDVTMRLIADRLLAVAPNSTFVDNEIVSHQPKLLQAPNGGFHVYCSFFNPGALALMQEVANERDFRPLEGVASQENSRRAPTPQSILHIATDKLELTSCDHMLLYLNSQTWTRGADTDALAGEVEEAIRIGIHILLAHEMPGTGGQEQRFGCEFGTFFACPDGATPISLLSRQIYSEIAVPLKGGPWRKASMALLGSALSMAKDEAKDAKMGTNILHTRVESKAWWASKLHSSRKLGSDIVSAWRSRWRISWRTRSACSQTVVTATVALTSSTTMTASSTV